MRKEVGERSGYAFQKSVDREKEEGEKIEGFKIYSTVVFPLFLRGYEQSFSMNQ